MALESVIYLSNVRLSFPNLVEPQKTTNNNVERISYNADFIMEPNHPGFAAFLKRYGELAVDKWKEHAQTVMNMIQQDRKQRCYGQGSERVKKTTFQPYDGYVGMVFISAGNKNPPQMIQADGTPVDPFNTMAYQALARRLYAGCRVNAAIKPWAQDNQHGRGIRCDLVAVQFHADDKAFGEGHVDAAPLFQAQQAPAAAAPQMAPQMPPVPFPSNAMPQPGPAAAAPMPSFLAPRAP